jgi:undecaprenyl pyrophosphate phosphatase UppP
MAVMGGIVQGLVEFFPLFAQAFLMRLPKPLSKPWR